MSGITPVSPRIPVPDSPGGETVPQRETPARVPASLNRKEAEQTQQTLNQVLNPLNLSMEIQFDDAHNTYGFKIVDRVTKEVVREFPSPGVLVAARDAVQGLFVDQHS